MHNLEFRSRDSRRELQLSRDPKSKKIPTVKLSCIKLLKSDGADTWRSKFSGSRAYGIPKIPKWKFAPQGC